MRNLRPSIWQDCALRFSLLAMDFLSEVYVDSVVV